MEETINIIHAFIQILQQRNPAFFPTAWQALSELDRALANLASDKNIDIAHTILDWCDKYPEIKPALRNIFEVIKKDIVESEEQRLKNYDRSHEARIIYNKSLVQKTIKEAIQQPPPNSTQQ